MKIDFTVCVLGLVIFGCHATQWRELKSPLTSPYYKPIMDKLFPKSDVDRTNNGKIANGTPASLGQFPFQVYLYTFNRFAGFLCGGSVRILSH